MKPMHIFAGKRFKVDPMDGCVSNAYFGKSQKGWITTELWLALAAHFIKYAPAVHPLVLVVDGHSSHIDANTSKLCKENRILLYRLLSQKKPRSVHHKRERVASRSQFKQVWQRRVLKMTISSALSWLRNLGF